MRFHGHWSSRTTFFFFLRWAGIFQLISLAHILPEKRSANFYSLPFDNGHAIVPREWQWLWFYFFAIQFGRARGQDELCFGKEICSFDRRPWQLRLERLLHFLENRATVFLWNQPNGEQTVDSIRPPVLSFQTPRAHCHWSNALWACFTDQHPSLSSLGLLPIKALKRSKSSTCKRAIASVSDSICKEGLSRQHAAWVVNVGHPPSLQCSDWLSGN